MSRRRQSLRDGFSSRPLVWAAAGILLLLYFGGLGSVPLLEPDEGRYTEIPREMIKGGDWVLPHLDGVLYFEKPPLNYWMTAASLEVFGLTPFATRFPNAVIGLAGVILAWVLGRKMGGARSGLLSAAILATSPLYLAMAHIATLDMSVGFFVAAALCCFWFAQSGGGEDGWRAKAPWWGLFLFSALAVMSKGLIGLLLPCAIIGLFILSTWRWEIFKSVPWFSGTALFLAVALPWHLLAASRNGKFIDIYIVREHFLRYLTPVSDRQEPWWFFIPVLVVGLMPWSGTWPALARLWPGKLESLRKENSNLLFLALWAAFIFVFFSASSSKLIPYMVPALWPLAVLLGSALDSVWEHKASETGWGLRSFAALAALAWVAAGAAFVWIGLGKVPRLSEWEHPLYGLVLFGCLLAVVAAFAASFWLMGDLRRGAVFLGMAAALFFGALWASAPQVQTGRDVRGMASYLDTHLKAGDGLYSFNYYPQTLPVYLRREIGVVAFQGELEFGVSQLPDKERSERFPSAAEFKPIWDSSKRVYLVTDRESLPVMERDGLGHYTILAERSIVLLLTNRPLENG